MAYFIVSLRGCQEVCFCASGSAARRKRSGGKVWRKEGARPSNAKSWFSESELLNEPRFVGSIVISSIPILPASPTVFWRRRAKSGGWATVVRRPVAASCVNVYTTDIAPRAVTTKSCNLPGKKRPEDVATPA